MAAVWALVLVLAAGFTGWALAAYLRRGNPTERVPPFRWRITPATRGPGWALGLVAGGAFVCFIAVQRIASGRLALSMALTVAWIVLTLLVQAAVLRGHNQRLGQRS